MIDRDERPIEEVIEEIAEEPIETLADAYKRFPATMAYLALEEFSTPVQLIVAQQIVLDLDEGAPK